MQCLMLFCAWLTVHLYLMNTVEHRIAAGDIAPYLQLRPCSCDSIVTLDSENDTSIV